MYLIEESAVKEFCRQHELRIPPRLWAWLQSDGPVIRAEAAAVLPDGRVRFVSPGGVIDLPEGMVFRLGDLL